MSAVFGLGRRLPEKGKGRFGGCYGRALIGPGIGAGRRSRARACDYPTLKLALLFFAFDSASAPEAVAVTTAPLLTRTVTETTTD